MPVTRRSFLAGAAGGLAVAAAAGPARAIDLTVTDANIQPVPIALPSFEGDPQFAPQVAAVIQADLKRSGLFQPLDPASFIDKTVPFASTPTFQNWKVINAQALLVGTVEQAGGQLRAQFRLWDIFASRYLAGQTFATTPDNWRRIAHKIADQVYQRMTGEKGYFDTRIVFVDQTGPKTKRIRRLAIMDQDGANVRYITRGAELVSTPRFSPSSQLITYMSYGQGEPEVYVLNLENGQRGTIAGMQGVTFAPRFSPDGRRLVMSREQGGITNLYVSDVGGGGLQRLTNDTNIDTGPCYSPDGQNICFESDRSGTQQIYVMPAGGGQAQRISFGPGRYATPVWSPRGDFIAFTRIGGGSDFAIGVMKPDGTGERILTEGYHNEGPTWAPNGRVVMFFRDLGDGPKIYTVDLTGRNEQLVPTPSWASAPAWSPLLP